VLGSVALALSLSYWGILTYPFHLLIFQGLIQDLKGVVGGGSFGLIVNWFLRALLSFPLHLGESILGSSLMYMVSLSWVEH
jgi:hypothetical protein